MFRLRRKSRISKGANDPAFIDPNPECKEKTVLQERIKDSVTLLGRNVISAFKTEHSEPRDEALLKALLTDHRLESARLKSLKDELVRHQAEHGC